MKIKKMVKLKNDQYKIEFCDGTSLKTYDEVLLHYNLLYQKEVDELSYQKIIEDTLDYTMYHKVLKYTLLKYRSTKEIQKYMDRLEIPLKEQQIIIEKLKKNNALNEDKFVEAFISDQMHFTNNGPNKIKKQLSEHDISIDSINQYLNEYDDSFIEDRLTKIAQKKIKTLHNSNMIMKQKLMNYLFNLGYDKEMIQRVLSHIEINSEDAIQKDYDKIKRKLSSKYDDINLEYQIISKLYQKGYSKEEINSLKKEA